MKNMNAQFTPTGDKLTSDQIKFGYWFVTHKLLLRRIGIMALMAFDAFLFIVVAYNLLNFYIFSQPEINAQNLALTSDRIKYEYWQEKSAPLPLTMDSVQYLGNVPGKFDLVAFVNNPNKTWYLKELTYHFQDGSVATPSKTTFVLPLQNKVIMELAFASGQSLTNPTLIVDNVKWEKTADYEFLRDKVWNVTISEAVFTSEANAAGGPSLNKIKFNATNNSAYNFWDAQFNVLMYRGETLVYVNSIPARTFSSQEKKELNINVFPETVFGTKVEVVPEVDILKPESFKGFGE